MLMEWMLAAQLAVASPGFADALALAEREEGALSGDYVGAKQETQGAALGRALPTCFATTEQVHAETPFFVVLQLDAEGRVTRSWSKGPGEATKCTERALAQATYFRPPSAPFHTWIRLGSKP